MPLDVLDLIMQCTMRIPHLFQSTFLPDILTRWYTDKDTGRPAPEYPFMFFKAITALHDHGGEAPTAHIAQEALPDYEGDLALVVVREGKDIPAEDALEGRVYLQK